MAVVIRARKFLTNKLLSRKQMILDVIHPDLANVSKDKLKEIVAKKYKVDARNVVMFGFKTHYGGGRSTGFCLIYDAHQYLLKYEPRYRLQRVKTLLKAGILTKKKYTRKGYKEIKGKAKRTRGKEITKIMGLKFNSPLEFRQQKAQYLKNFVAQN